MATITQQSAMAAGNTPSAQSAALLVDPSPIINGDIVAVRNSAGSDSHNATAVVSGSTLIGVNLASTVAMVDSGDTTSVEPSGSFTDTVTFTVAAGAITAIVQS